MATDILNAENIFVMGEDRAFHQDIKGPLRIGIFKSDADQNYDGNRTIELDGQFPCKWR